MLPNDVNIGYARCGYTPGLITLLFVKEVYYWLCNRVYNHSGHTLCWRHQTSLRSLQFPYRVVCVSSRSLFRCVVSGCMFNLHWSIFTCWKPAGSYSLTRPNGWYEPMGRCTWLVTLLSECTLSFSNVHCALSLETWVASPESGWHWRSDFLSFTPNLVLADFLISHGSCVELWALVLAYTLFWLISYQPWTFVTVYLAWS